MRQYIVLRNAFADKVHAAEEESCEGAALLRRETVPGAMHLLDSRERIETEMGLTSGTGETFLPKDATKSTA